MTPLEKLQWLKREFLVFVGLCVLTLLGACLVLKVLVGIP